MRTLKISEKLSNDRDALVDAIDQVLDFVQERVGFILSDIFSDQTMLEIRDIAERSLLSGDPASCADEDVIQYLGIKSKF